MSKLKNLEDLFHHHLKDIYSAESQLVDALPKMGKRANENKLKKAFSNHLEETNKQIERLEESRWVFFNFHSNQCLLRY